MRALLPPALLTALALPAHADVPRVVTDITPVHSLVARVMDGVGTPDLTIRAGGSPHDYALRPSEARALSNADLVIWIGPELSPALARSVDALAHDTARLDLLDLPGTVTHEFRGLDDHDHGHDDDHGEHEAHAAADDHDDHAADDDHGHDDHAHDDHGHDDDHAEAKADDRHDHGPIDPHAWLDPENGKLWLGAIAEQLAQLDPAHAETYRANAAAGVAGIEAAELAARQAIADARKPRFVVTHDAYQYFEQRFALEHVGSVALSDDSEPGAAHVQELQALVAEEDVTCVFGEADRPLGIIGQMAEMNGIAVGILDPLGVKLAVGPELYPSLIRDMGRAFATCSAQSS
ncbi:MAG: zinc ABC transporter substrate-binding protein [Pseudomonadota bacterium]